MPTLAEWWGSLFRAWCLNESMTKLLSRRARLCERACVSGLACALLATFPCRPEDHAEGTARLRGSVLQHPEQMSGVWEAENGATVIGLEIDLTTRVKGDSRTLQGVDQFFQNAQIEVFERARRAQWAVGNGNWFADDSAGVEWSGTHLEIRSAAAPAAGIPEIQVDLRFDPRAEPWTGRFHRGHVDQSVTMRRPHAGRDLAQSPFVGTWKRGSVMNNCLHIAEEQDSSLVAWSDDLVVPGALRYANGLKRPEEVMERYGIVAQVISQTAEGIGLQLHALSAICCSIEAGGILSPDRMSIRTKEHPTGRQEFDVWHRVRGSSCIAEEPRPPE